MKRQIVILEKGPWEKVLNMLVYAFLKTVYVLSGNGSEKPQRTYSWSCTPYHAGLNDTMLVYEEGDKECKVTFLGHLFPNIPVCGGWKKFIVVSVPSPNWYVGFRSGNKNTIIKTLQHGEVRVLVSPQDVAFFAIDADTGQQLLLTKITEGIFGQRNFSFLKKISMS